MRRTPVVIVTTVAGLAGVLMYHTSSAASGVSPLPGIGGGAGSTHSPVAAKSPVAGSGSGAGSGTGSSGSGTGSSGSGTGSSGSGTSTGTRTAVGQKVDYSWGTMSVKVTVTNGKITSVTVASLDDYGNPRSQYIDQQSIPMLEQQAVQAQSANIQGVSGASYTSAGFQESLQSALSSLGFK